MLPEPAATAVPGGPGGPPQPVGPHTGLPLVLRRLEQAGHADPAAAWAAFTRTWNWSAALPTAIPLRSAAARPVAAAACGGYMLSGTWRQPPLAAGAVRWLALPLAGRGRRRPTEAAPEGPDVFVVPSTMLRRSPDALTGRGSGAETGSTFRLHRAHVPGGFATHSSGRPLRPESTAFFWTAVTAMGLGAARRLADALAAVPAAAPTAPAAVPPPAAAAELAEALRDAELVFRAGLHTAADVDGRPGAAADEALADRVRRTSQIVHHVVTAACEYAVSFLPAGGERPLLALAEGCSGILQCMRFSAELMPPAGNGTAGKAPAERGGRR